MGANTDFPAAIVITSRPQTITSPTSGPLLTSSSETDSAVYTVSDAAGDPVTNYPVTLSWVKTNQGPIATIDGVEVTNEGMTATTSDTGMVTVNAAATSTSLFGNYTLLLTAGPLSRPPVPCRSHKAFPGYLSGLAPLPVISRWTSHGHHR